MQSVGFLLVLAVGNGLLAMIPATVAANKGRSFGLWWLYGFVLFLIALIHALLAEEAGRVRCAHCAEAIRPEASICPHCRRAVDPRPATPVASPAGADGLRLLEPGDVPDVPGLPPADSDRVLHLIAAHEGDLTAAGRAADASIVEAVEQLIGSGYLVAESWDTVRLTGEGRTLLASLPPPDEPDPEPVIAREVGGSRPADPVSGDTPQTVEAWVGRERVNWSLDRFEFVHADGEREDVDLADVIAVDVDKAIADAWLRFTNGDGSERAIAIPRAAVGDARAVASHLQQLLERRITEH